MRLIITILLLLTVLHCKSQNWDYELQQKNQKGIKLLISGGSLAVLSATMYYLSERTPDGMQNNKGVFKTAAFMYGLAAIPCIVVGTVNIEASSKKYRNYKFDLTIKTNGTAAVAALKF